MTSTWRDGACFHTLLTFVYHQYNFAVYNSTWIFDTYCPGETLVPMLFNGDENVGRGRKHY